MTTVKIKTAELTGGALDWAVAKAVNPIGFVLRENDECEPSEWILGLVKYPSSEECKIFEIDPTTDIDIETLPLLCNWSPSTDWSQGGPLIDDHNVWLSDDEGVCVASCNPHIGKYVAEGDTNLIAVCRAIVISKMGKEVSIPSELVGQ